MSLRLTFATILFFITAACAEDVAFSVTADRTSASLGEQIQITAQVASNKRLSGSFTPQIPKSEDFSVTSTNQNQNQSTSIQVINGKMTQSVNITYLFYYNIAPKKIGSFIFPALTCTIDGATYTSNPFTINIGKEEAAQSSDVKFSLLCNKKNPVVGEQLFFTLQIAVKPQSGAQLSQQGFSQALDKLIKSIGKDFSYVTLTNQVKPVNEVIGGEHVTVFRFQLILFPLNAGTISIPPIPLEFVTLKRVQNRRADPFEDFFGNDVFGGGVQQIQKNTISNGVTFQISKLPEPPANYSGAVGSFTMTSSASPKEVASGDAVTLSITLRGNTRAGNMADVTVPQITDCEIFPPEKHLSIDTTQNGLSCQKSYKYLIIPRQEGSVTIPALAWTYFDPASRAYKTLKSEPIVITVTKGKTTQAPQPRYLTQEDIRLVGQDIRYIKTGIALTKQTDTPYRNILFLVLFPLPFLIALFALLYKFQAQRFDKDSALSMRKNAARAANKNIAMLRKKAALPSSEFLSSLAACLEKFVTHRHGFEATGKTLDELKQELADRGAQQTTIDQLAAFFQDMDMYRFGMRTLNADSRTILLDKAAGFVRDLERIKGSAS